MNLARKASIILCVLGVRGISAATFLTIAPVDALAALHYQVGNALMQRLLPTAAGIATIGWVTSP